METKTFKLTKEEKAELTSVLTELDGEKAVVNLMITAQRRTNERCNQLHNRVGKRLGLPGEKLLLLRNGTARVKT